MSRLRGILRVIGTAAIIIGAGFMSYAAVVIIQAREHSESFHPGTPSPRVTGAAIGDLRIERIGMRAVVSEGDSDAVLRLGAGHLADTPWPDQPGNVVIAGHRDTVFRPLRNVVAGDRIDLTTATGVAHYRVISTRVVSPSDLSALEPSHDNTLTLITCYPFRFVGRAPERFVVHAAEEREVR